MTTDDDRPTRRKLMRIAALAGGTLGLAAVGKRRAVAQGAPLPSWNEGTAKRSIVDFVARVTTPGRSFVPIPELIAVFDEAWARGWAVADMKADWKVVYP